MNTLIVDDDVDFINLIKKHLEGQGLNVFIAQGGREALEILSNTRVQLVISDWVMPGMDGLALCREIRALKTAGYIYIILMSVRNKKEDVVRGLDAGADDYLTKPCNPLELRSRLEAGMRVLNSDNPFQEEAVSHKRIEHDTFTGNNQSQKFNNLPYRLEEEVDLLEYLAAVLRYKYLILLVAVLCSIAAYGLTYRKPKLYEAYVNTTLVEYDDPGGVSPDKRRAPEMITLVEHGYIMGQYRNNFLDIIMATMKSHLFTTKFVKDENIIRYLFEEHWDNSNLKWKDGFRPDIKQATSMFNTKIRFIHFNEETGLMRLRICWKDPVLAARWANRYIELFNEHMRMKAIDEGRNKLEALQAELLRTDIVEIQKTIFRLIEAQTAVVMTASARKDYVLEVIDPALPNPEKCSPARKRTAVLALFGALALGLTASVGSVIVKKVMKAIRKYN